MPSSLFGRVRSIVRKKARRGGVKVYNVAQQVKGLKGRPGIRVNLGGSHIERLKDAHCELIKWEGNMEVREKAGVHIKEWGVGSRPPQGNTLGRPAGQNAKVARVLIHLQNRVFGQKFGHRRHDPVVGRDLDNLRVHPTKVHERNG